MDFTDSEIVRNYLATLFYFLVPFLHIGLSQVFPIFVLTPVSLEVAVPTRNSEATLSQKKDVSWRLAGIGHKPEILIILRFYVSSPGLSRMLVETSCPRIWRLIDTDIEA